MMVSVVEGGGLSGEQLQRSIFVLDTNRFQKAQSRSYLYTCLVGRFPMITSIHLDPKSMHNNAIVVPFFSSSGPVVCRRLASK